MTYGSMSFFSMPKVFSMVLREKRSRDLAGTIGTDLFLTGMGLFPKRLFRCFHQFTAFTPGWGRVVLRLIRISPLPHPGITVWTLSDPRDEVSCISSVTLPSFFPDTLHSRRPPPFSRIFSSANNQRTPRHFQTVPLEGISPVSRPSLPLREDLLCPPSLPGNLI